MTNQVPHNIARGTDDNLRPFLKRFGTTRNAGVALSLCVLSDFVSDLLKLQCCFPGWCKYESLAVRQIGIDILDDGYGEGSEFIAIEKSPDKNIVA